LPMDIASAEKKFQDVTYKDDQYEDLLKQLTNPLEQQGYHLCLLLGRYAKRKDEALEDISDSSGRDIHSVDANEIIKREEAASYENIDYLFSTLDTENALLHLQNGSRLCGVYTGYTQSRVKYATPQERYFLKEIQEFGGLYVIDIHDPNDADNSIRRAAQSIVWFNKPESRLKKLFKKVRNQLTVHGFELPNDRPAGYGNSPSNF